jgi:hypothetical protein
VPSRRDRFAVWDQLSDLTDDQNEDAPVQEAHRLGRGVLVVQAGAAVCYAAAFQLLSGTAGAGMSVVAHIEGVVLIILATPTLPALLRFVVPLVSSVGGIWTGEVLATGAALAAGAAAVVTRSGSGEEKLGTGVVQRGKADFVDLCGHRHNSMTSGSCPSPLTPPKPSTGSSMPPTRTAAWPCHRTCTPQALTS